LIVAVRTGGGGRTIEQAIEAALRPRLGWGPRARGAARAQDFRLNGEEPGLDEDRAAAAPQKGGKPQDQFALDRRLGIVIGNNGCLEGLVPRSRAGPLSESGRAAKPKFNPE